MGKLLKYKIEKLKREKRKAKAVKKRKENTRSKIVRFLIVCEGACTEPNYFRALVKDRFSEVREEVIKGEGMFTCALVKRTLHIKDELEQKRQLPFDRVWVVFDRDEFSDVNEAIRLCQSYSFNSAWTNEAFELWYYLHFQYLNTGLSRHDYIDKLEKEIRKHDSFKNYKYEKNNPDVYNVLSSIGNEDFAKQNAKRLRSLFVGNVNYQMHNPCTTVDLLVNELENPVSLIK
ncbi:MAG: RloB family protein [Prevotella sp.]|nr:RloB family protein [Prevotella sp.]